MQDSGEAGAVCAHLEQVHLKPASSSTLKALMDRREHKSVHNSFGVYRNVEQCRCRASAVHFGAVLGPISQQRVFSFNATRQSLVDALGKCTMIISIAFICIDCVV